MSVDYMIWALHSRSLLFLYEVSGNSHDDKLSVQHDKSIIVN